LLLLGDKEKETDLTALNMEVYNVLSLQLMYGDTTELIVLKNNQADQEKAMELLRKALKELQDEKRMVDNDPEIVDITTFKEVPKEFFIKKEEKKVTTTHSYNGGAYGWDGYNYNHNNTTDWEKTRKEREEKKKKEEKMRWTPTLIKRDGKLPEMKFLNAMKKKVAMIAAGDYEFELEDPDPEGASEDKKTTA